MWQNQCDVEFTFAGCWDIWVECSSKQIDYTIHLR